MGLVKGDAPNVNDWLAEAKADPSAPECGMYLVHNGVVRELPKAKVRQGIDDGKVVIGMRFDYDEAKVEAAIEEAYGYTGVKYIQVWLARGELKVGDDIMYVLIGADIRPNTIDALQKLVGTIKNECVSEVEIYR